MLFFMRSSENDFFRSPGPLGLSYLRGGVVTIGAFGAYNGTPSPWAAAEGGGKTYRVNLGGGGGETYCRVCSPKPLLEASEIGVGLVGASFI